MTAESRKAFEADGYGDADSNPRNYNVWRSAWQARDAELAAKDARIAELENELDAATRLGKITLSAAGDKAEQIVALMCERDQLRATIAAIELETDPVVQDCNKSVLAQVVEVVHLLCEARKENTRLFAEYEVKIVSLYEQNEHLALRNSRLVAALQRIDDTCDDEAHIIAREAIAANAVKGEG